ncbi:MAG: Holliday junction resolvase RuvX [Alphaproteobacteria bacterium]|nr:Holliday junction resolvase RuvX [Alphaproteobacteria bacterium]
MIVDAKELCFSEYKGKCRALCIDYGDKRVGIAISDINWMISSPLVVLSSQGVYRGIREIVETHEVGVIVVGEPIALNGAKGGKQLEKVNKFVRKLNEMCERIAIVMWDERLSTCGAERIITGCKSRNNRDKIIDKVAASFILEGFLEHVSNTFAVS